MANDEKKENKSKKNILINQFREVMSKKRNLQAPDVLSNLVKVLIENTSCPTADFQHVDNGHFEHVQRHIDHDNYLGRKPCAPRKP